MVFFFVVRHYPKKDTIFISFSLISNEPYQISLVQLCSALVFFKLNADGEIYIFKFHKVFCRFYFWLSKNSANITLKRLLEKAKRMIFLEFVFKNPVLQWIRLIKFKFFAF